MADFDDRFRLCTGNINLVEIFECKLNELDDVSIERTDNSVEYILEMTGAPFGRSSQWAAEKMATLLMNCIETVPDASFTASYSLDDYHGGDQAEVTYAYSGSDHCLTVNGSFAEYEVEQEEEDCEGNTFAISGVLSEYEDRDELVDVIESLGAFVSEQIDSSIDYLICNDKSSASSQLATELGIPVLTESVFIQRFLDPCAYIDESFDYCQSYRVTEQYRFNQETKKWSCEKKLESLQSEGAGDIDYGNEDWDAFDEEAKEDD